LISIAACNLKSTSGFGKSEPLINYEKDYVCKELLLPNKKKKKQELSPEQRAKISYWRAGELPLNIASVE